jgi:dimethylhistidine N-methyltransferase
MAAAVSPYAAPGVAETSAFGQDMLACLSEMPHAIAPKYFYDTRGSQLFDRICELPEYYVTRTELSIFRRHICDMASLIGPGAEIIEFGAGSLLKARLLLDVLEAPHGFVAIDISGEHLNAACRDLRRSYPALAVTALVADFTHPETLPLAHSVGGRRIGFFPGSTIGNFSPQLASQFLIAAARLLRGGGLLIGVDLVKDPALLHAAYNDSAGITAAFNRNLLVRANRELGCNFDIDAFQHYAFYHPVRQCIEMHLISAEAQQISLGGHRFRWAAGESIHTESSQKYTVDGFRQLATACGFLPRATWCDDLGLFSIHWLESPSARP